MFSPRHVADRRRRIKLAARIAITVSLFAASWLLLARLPPDDAGRRIAPTAFLVFVGALSITAYFVTRGAKTWLRIGAALLAGTAAAACFMRSDEAALGSILAAGLMVSCGGPVAFSGHLRNKSNSDSKPPCQG